MIQNIDYWIYCIYLFIGHLLFLFLKVFKYNTPSNMPELWVQDEVIFMARLITWLSLETQLTVDGSMFSVYKTWLYIKHIWRSTDLLDVIYQSNCCTKCTNIKSEYWSYILLLYKIINLDSKISQPTVSKQLNLMSISWCLHHLLACKW